MLKALALLTGLSMELSAQLHPSPILLIHRDLLKPGNEAAYRKIEEDTARLMRDAGPLTSEQQVQFPNPYLAAEPLTGPKEVWFLTGWNSRADYDRVGDEYSRRAPAPLVAALDRNSKKKAALTFEPISVFANYRQDVSRGEQWSVGRGALPRNHGDEAERSIRGCCCRDGGLYTLRCDSCSDTRGSRCEGTRSGSRSERVRCTPVLDKARIGMDLRRSFILAALDSKDDSIDWRVPECCLT